MNKGMEPAAARWRCLFITMSRDRANYTQLIREAKGENYSRRRVDLLKAQIQHLERQVC